MKKRPKNNISTLSDLLLNGFTRLQDLVNRTFNYQGYFENNKYARLMRLDKPIGYLLIMLPCLWSIAFASKNIIQIILLSLLFAIGAIIIRSAGCIINDLIDKDIDKSIERTKNRPLASNEVTVKEAITLLIMLLGLAAILLFALSKTSIVISIIALIPITIYPFLKRYTHYAQIFLGFTFNLGVVIAWFTVSDKPSFNPIMLYLAAAAWTIGYDTIYALQDKGDDIKASLKSLAILYDKKAPDIIWMFYQMFIILLGITGLNTYMNLIYFLFLGIGAYQLYWQVEELDIDKAEDCERKFKSNVTFGIIILIGIYLGKFKLFSIF